VSIHLEGAETNRHGRLEFVLLCIEIQSKAITMPRSSVQIPLCTNRVGVAVTLMTGVRDARPGHLLSCPKDFRGVPQSLKANGSMVHPLIDYNFLPELISWSSALLDKPPVVQPLKNFPTFYGTRSFSTVFTGAAHWSLRPRLFVTFRNKLTFFFLR
jgi:hypothetical protein